MWTGAKILDLWNGELLETWSPCCSTCLHGREIFSSTLLFHLCSLVQKPFPYWKQWSLYNIVKFVCFHHAKSALYHMTNTWYRHRKLRLFLQKWLSGCILLIDEQMCWDRNVIHVIETENLALVINGLICSKIILLWEVFIYANCAYLHTKFTFLYI